MRWCLSGCDVGKSAGAGGGELAALMYMHMKQMTRSKHSMNGAVDGSRTAKSIPGIQSQHLFMLCAAM